MQHNRQLIKKTFQGCLLTLMVTMLCAVGVTAGAQTSLVKTKMSPWLQTKYQQEELAVKKNGGPKRVQGRRVRTYILTLVKSSDEAATIRQQGGVVLQDFSDRTAGGVATEGNICAAFLPVDKLGELAQNPHILRMEANAPSQLTNDTSAVIINADKAWNLSPSAGLPQAFTGKGVVAAVMDIGFDFTHPAFRHDDGTSRFKWFWEPLAPDANADNLGMVYNSPAEVLAALHCINADNDNHGTHVLGTMAGRGLDGRYVGMAPEADIMGAHVPLGVVPDEYTERVVEYIRSHLADYPMLEEFIEVEPSDAIELVELYRIFQAADAIGEPCVVNWSFGSSTNFFSDTTLFEEVFNSLVCP